jgi:hypothetical protein
LTYTFITGKQIFIISKAAILANTCLFDLALVNLYSHFSHVSSSAWMCVPGIALAASIFAINSNIKRVGLDEFVDPHYEAELRHPKWRESTYFWHLIKWALHIEICY